MTDPLAPGATIGILGGGQLGRMLALAAARLGLRCHIYDPDPSAPAKQVCAASTTAPWQDQAALEAFARAVDVVTYEFENIPTSALDMIEAHTALRPNRRALSTSQDRLTEKNFLGDLGLAVAPFAQVDSADMLAGALAQMGGEAILKTRRMGYDGKGQIRLSQGADCAAAMDALGHAPAILEGLIPFSSEISIIAARSAEGQIAAFDPGENQHENGILRRSTVPAKIPAAQRSDAILIAANIMNALDYIGVIGVELFVTPTALIVNEIAPRVHNSGHWTEAACTICQFEQHIRAVAGWPLGDGSRHSDAVMENLIGAEAADWQSRNTTGKLHLYGKADIRAGRKMGHITHLTPRS